VLARASVLSIDPTVHANGSEAGEKPAASVFEFPAATPTNTPLCTDDATAAFIAAEKLPPMDRLMYAPLGQLRAAASPGTKLMAEMMPEMVPAPVSPRALTP
jgi:hypothetical protein